MALHIITEANRCLLCKKPLCQEGCPIHTPIPEVIRLFRENRLMEAGEMLFRNNPMSVVCSIVCDHGSQCAGNCIQNRKESPVLFYEIEKFISDAYLDRMPTSAPAEKKEAVAVIGSGPAGMTVAIILSKAGYQVTIFEERNMIGGMFRYGIPDYRLPSGILQHEIENIKRTGVKIHCNQKIGTQQYAKLKEEYDAIMISIGAQKVATLKIRGEDLHGVYHGLDFLKRVALKDDLDFTGKRVAVIGGGNTAIDSARTAIRLNAAQVHVIYRRTADDMPADKLELKDAIEEGVLIRPLLTPTRFIGGKGRVKQIELAILTPGEFDETGRKFPVDTGKRDIEDFDIVIPAISQAPDIEFLENSLTSNANRINVNRHTQGTSEPGVFAGGDASRGPKDIVNAVADGKLAASNIDIYLGGDGVLIKGFEQEISDNHIEGDIDPHGRFLPRQLSSRDAITGFMERNLGMHELDARAEASRCLRCDRR